MKTRSALKEGGKKTHKDLAAVASAASFFSQNTFWEVKDCTELLILNSSQDLKRLYSHASIVSMLFITSLISKPF